MTDPTPDHITHCCGENDPHPDCPAPHFGATASPQPDTAPEGPTWPDGTVRLPGAIESWLDGHFEGEKDDDSDLLAMGRNCTAVALWSLIHRQGDPESDSEAIGALAAALAPKGPWTVDSYSVRGPAGEWVECFNVPGGVFPLASPDLAERVAAALNGAPATPAERAVVDAAETWADAAGSRGNRIGQTLSAAKAARRALEDAVAGLRSERNKNDE